MRHRKCLFLVLAGLMLAFVGIGEVNALTATGGTINTVGNYTIHTFTSSGTFNVTGSGNVEVLVVAGGGGGGGYYYSGGGGAGGLVYNAAYSASGPIEVTVGQGGAGSTDTNRGANGINSVFGTITAIGGGGGGAYSAFASVGGSGGGGNGYTAYKTAAAGTSGQGNAGGAGTGYPPYPISGGGGGGAGGVGSVGSVNGGNGGVGLAYLISGSSVYYAGGGGGASYPGQGAGGAGGAGGGGAGSNSAAAGTSGTPNTGGGGGGASTDTPGGNGGSGIVIVKYLAAMPPNISINSPSSGAVVNGASSTLNWTPYNFTSNPTCNLSRNGTIIFSGVCTNNQPCTATNTTTNGTYLWNVTCYAGGNSVTTETRNFTVVIPVFSAIGGTITTSGNYTIHTFTSSGTFNVTGSGNVEVLVVAGGGGGGAGYGGGGGAGGLIYNPSFYLSSGAVPVSVGNGGLGSPALGQANIGSNGGNSSFSTLLAFGGGGGAGYLPVSGPGASGGSGGGGTYSGPGGSGVPGQGYAGGTSSGAPIYGGGGGGAAGAAGTNGTSTSGGNGGPGLSYSISGSNIYYAGGGGGGTYSAGTGGSGGLGGGGNGGSGTGDNPGLPGAAGTGSGGGGSSYKTSTLAGGNGGSGIVIIRYLANAAAPIISLNSPSPGATINSSSVTFNWTASSFASNPSCSVSISGRPVSVNFTSAGDYIEESSSYGTNISGGVVKLRPTGGGIGTTDLTSTSYNHSQSSVVSIHVGSYASDNIPSYSYSWWSAPGATSGWVKIDYGSATTVAAYRIYAFNDSTVYISSMPKTWIFKGSNDGSSWASLDTRSNVAAWSQGENRTYNISSPGAYRYYMLDISANEGDPSYTILPEWEMFPPAGSVYNTSSSYYVTTSSASQISTLGWSNISSVSINQTTPSGASIRYLVSFDGRSTWKRWNGSAWLSSSLSAINSEGMSKSELEGISQAQWSSSGGFLPGTLDFAADLNSTVSNVTPELDEITINPASAIIYSGACTLSSPCAATSSVFPGAYSWNVSCNSTGQSAASETRNFTVNVTADTTPPSVILSSPSSGTKTPTQAQAFSCTATDAIGLSNITLSIWNSSNSLVYSNSSAVSGASNSSTWSYAFPGRGNFTWNCLAYDTSSNSAYAASNATITIQKYAKLEIVYPANNAGIPRGKNGAEDIMGRVSDNMSILALITDNETGAPIPGANCGLSIDSSPKGTATANSSGNCIFSYNKSGDSIGVHQISLNISSISADYVPSAESVNSSYNLENWTMRLDINNYRTGAGSYYYAGDLSLVNITVKRNSQPANITGIWLVMTDQMDGVLSELSMGSFTQVSTGVYQTELLVPDDVEWLRWKSVVGAPFPGQDSNASSNQHTDITVNQPPSAPLNFSLVGSSGAPLENSQITIYRQGALGQQAIFNQTLGSGTGSVQKSIIQNDSGYDLEIRTPNSNSIMISNFNLSAGLNFVTQQANFTGPAPNQTRLMSAVLASNATNFLKSTLTFAKTFEPDKICSCQNWNFSSSSCGGAWVCNSTSAYEYSSNSTHFWFNVTHFTGYAIGQSENENLTIWDETDSGMPYGNQMRYISQNIRFFANYSNSSSQPITGATCQIWFSDSGWSAMNYNSTNLYEYTRVFSSGGTFNWNVSCNKSGQTTLNATDTVLVNSTIAVVLNSPADGSTQKNSAIEYNWTPYGFPGNPSCNLTRNGSLVHISSCTNNEPCTFANTTANGYYIWNVTCNSGATTRESPTRTLTVNTLSHSTAAEGILNMNITEISSISLPQNSISFGTVEITQTYDSYPSQFFVIKNDGNTIVDIEVNATNPFLSSSCSSLPCSAYQVKVGANETTPYPSCSSNPSQESYANMFGSSSGLLINDFNFVDNDDSANIYIKFRLPNDEPPGSKSSTVTFWAKSVNSYACD